MPRIFAVEDDDNIRELTLYALRGAGFDAEGFAEGATALARAAEAPPDLILLDIMLPGEDGVQILKRLRQNRRTQKLPVIFLTAKGAEYDRIAGLDAGADDYITKPFSVMELLSRVKAVLRRTAPDDSAGDCRVGAVLLSPGRRMVLVGDAAVTLTFKEFELLHLLMRNVGIVLSRDKILTEIWGYDYDGENRTVDMHIKSLRQKLYCGGDLIKTVRNVGYKIEDSAS
jgi:two-component system alkaline phosphatase synthesis response regulator PhoP